MKERLSPKEVSRLRLWIEYLRRSEKYRRFLEWYTDSKQRIEHWLNFQTHHPKYAIEPTHFEELYRRFGNVHDPTWAFDEWLESLAIERTMFTETAVVAADEETPWFPTFPRYVMRLSINFRAPWEQIVQELAAHIDRQRAIMAPELDAWRRWLLFVEGDLREDYLRRYLRVFDLKERDGLEMEQVALQLEREKIELPAHTRSLYLDLEKAKQIIHNVEHEMTFPGKY